MMKTILVIDDDSEILNTIQLILHDAGYHVITRTDGRQILNTLEETQPSLVMLDIKIGWSDGRDLCYTIKEDHRFARLPVMMISGTHGLRDISDEPNGPDDYLSKPFDIHELLAKVATLLA